MFKRLFFTLFGLGGGIAVGIWAVRKLDATQKALSPGHIADSLSGRWGEAVQAGREAMAIKEAELRAEHGLSNPGSRPRYSQFGPD